MLQLTKFPASEPLRALGRHALRLSVRALEALLPGCCLLCGDATTGGRAPAVAGPLVDGHWTVGLCPACRRDLPRAGDACPRCALPGPFAGRDCGVCMRRPPAFARAVSALIYVYPVDHLVQSFKFGRSLAAGEVLAAELAGAAVRSSGFARPDILVPVPLHFCRRALRGFNQSELLARRVSRDLGIRVHTGLLRRTRQTQAQSGLDLSGRTRNLRGAFRSRDAAGLRIALVDDVLTTGTTLDECARVLHAAGAARVEAWVAARVPAPHAPRTP